MKVASGKMRSSDLSVCLWETVCLRSQFLCPWIGKEFHIVIVGLALISLLISRMLLQLQTCQLVRFGVKVN